jgi:hypothetical protein
LATAALATALKKPSNLSEPPLVAPARSLSPLPDLAILPFVHGKWSPTQEAASELAGLDEGLVSGNPFRASQPVSPVWHAWQERTIPNLASAIYEDRYFDRMPYLGDALEEAGCADEALLDHCRGPEAHVRGCHVLDALLDRE